MTVMVTPCLWYVVGMKLVMSYVSFLKPLLHKPLLANADTPLNSTPATFHRRKQQLRCNFRKVALQKLHCNICFSAMRTSF